MYNATFGWVVCLSYIFLSSRNCKRILIAYLILMIYAFRNEKVSDPLDALGSLDKNRPIKYSDSDKNRLFFVFLNLICCSGKQSYWQCYFS